MQKLKDNVVILGLGNLLLGDEGVGVYVIHKLKTLKLPANIELIDGATTGFNLIPIFEKHKKDKFIIIDAIKIQEDKSDSKSSELRKKDNTYKKGDIYVIPLNKIYSLSNTNYENPEFISFHQIGLLDVLTLLLRTLKIKIKGYLIGINIFDPSTSSDSIKIEYSIELSPEVEEKIPKIIKLILKHIQYFLK